MTVISPALGSVAAASPRPDEGRPAPISCDHEVSCDHEISSDREVAAGVDGRPAPGGSGPARAAVALIRLYQLARTGRTSPCRFLPTCSQYAASAIERHGLRRGLRLALGRLARCRPGGPFGSDPVPE